MQDQRIRQILYVAVFKYVKNVCPYYITEVFEYNFQTRISSRNNHAILKLTFRKSIMRVEKFFIYRSLSMEQIVRFNENKQLFKYV